MSFEETLAATHPWQHFGYVSERRADLESLLTGGASPVKQATQNHWNSLRKIGARLGGRLALIRRDAIEKKFVFFCFCFFFFGKKKIDFRKLFFS